MANIFNPIPQHVALIMDGNGRWAQQRGLARYEGHQQGLEALRQLIDYLPDSGVKYLTVYAFSSENWKRPAAEVQGLMHLLVYYLKKYTQQLKAKNIRLHTIGRIEELPQEALTQLQQAKEQTQGCNHTHLTLALNYGARNEIIDALKRFIHTQHPFSASKDLEWSDFSCHLDTHYLPDPDLFIRTSGETRLSNFLLTQMAYTELYITPTLWPDFKPEDFKRAIEAYQTRHRRYGDLPRLEPSEMV